MRPPPINILELLRKHGLRPDKRLGQNFLIDETAFPKILQAAGLHPQDLVLEIGAGPGNLTRWLAVNARKVVAVEVDDRLVPVLKESVKSYPNVDVVQGDILEMDPGSVFGDECLLELERQGYVIIANLPYYITSAVIRHTLESKTRPTKMILMVQREVAQRICAEPGDMSLLALSVQVYGKPEIVAHIPAGAFYPRPNVDSAILRVSILPQPQIAPSLIDTFFHLIKAGFSQKRKTLRNALKANSGLTTPQVEELLQRAEIAPTRRAETLSIPEWAVLCTRYDRLLTEN